MGKEPPSPLFPLYGFEGMRRSKMSSQRRSETLLKPRPTVGCSPLPTGQRDQCTYQHPSYEAHRVMNCCIEGCEDIISKHRFPCMWRFPIGGWTILELPKVTVINDKPKGPPRQQRRITPFAPSLEHHSALWAQEWGAFDVANCRRGSHGPHTLMWLTADVAPTGHTPTTMTLELSFWPGSFPG